MSPPSPEAPDAQRGGKSLISCDARAIATAMDAQSNDCPSPCTSLGAPSRGPWGPLLAAAAGAPFPAKGTLENSMEATLCCTGHAALGGPPACTLAVPGEGAFLMGPATQGPSEERDPCDEEGAPEV